MFRRMPVPYPACCRISGACPYKTVERLYSDELVMMALHNLHVLLLKKKGIRESDATGDGTSYSLTVKKNYESYAQELKDKAKENRNEGDDKGKLLIV